MLVDLWSILFYFSFPVCLRCYYVGELGWALSDSGRPRGPDMLNAQQGVSRLHWAGCLEWSERAQRVLVS